MESITGSESMCHQSLAETNEELSLSRERVDQLEAKNRLTQQRLSESEQRLSASRQLQAQLKRENTQLLQQLTESELEVSAGCELLAAKERQLEEAAEPFKCIMCLENKLDCVFDCGHLC